MPVPGAKDQIVLRDQGGDPKVICRNGGSLFSELEEHPRVMMCGLFVGQEDLHPR